ncbi:MAG: hypothetical protein GAK28_02001 [Luteibacter sp.]|uniref:PilZ domain-containing protein n=1 Tax=Luteibacter sp. TaxID=1886636 RepID=UPI001380811E|nr:PilZ domain-containing protein [Luteibacter sp.]KAF1007030.1 MAG: hypothetical protein GAK28_02001 [Luteibacter sp.]
MTHLAEQRRSPRKRVTGPIPVIDAMSGDVLGQLCNLSVGGLMLLGAGAPATGVVRQVRFPLPDLRQRDREIVVGIHELWREQASTAGQYWSGHRIVAVVDEHLRLIEEWVGPQPD